MNKKISKQDAFRRDELIRSVFDEYCDKRKSKLRIDKELDTKGAFSSVYLLKGGSRRYILKAVLSSAVNINLSIDEVNEYMDNEIAALEKCKDCEYVVDLLDAAIKVINPATHERLYLLIMPKLEVSNKRIKKAGFSEEEILSMTKDIGRALSFCHSQGILHRDVKPGNIFYDAFKGHYVLADFNTAKSMLSSSERAVTRIGSLVAPEINGISDLHAKYNSDIYSLGMSALLMFSGMKESQTQIAESFRMLNPNLRHIIMNAIDGNPELRYQTADELLAAIEDYEQSVVNSHIEESAEYYSIQDCVSSFIDCNNENALRMAKLGYENNNETLSYLYAFMLGNETSLKILEPYVKQNKATALGLYGMILGNIGSDQSEQMISYISKAAEMGFPPAQYLIGRWLIDGQEGFKTDVERGLKYIFESFKRGFRPSLYYLKKEVKRNSAVYQSIQPMASIIDIELNGFSKPDFAEDVVLAIVGK